MKALFWAVGIAMLAVVVTLAARHNTGYLLLVLPPYRAEFSLNFLILALAGGFTAFYGIVRVVSATLRVPRQVREYRLARRKDKA
ncbi:MAG TPA: heme biosynthesis HemY N-terminal domain-containing protein, partial [Burkholderiales bacterium]|nr:heme biosynthesis HemY N-terminal domain-containing protein [Burkholderiales bacterium]